MEKIPSTSQPKSQNSHMAENARVLLYWGGEIIYGPNGVSYNAIPKRFVRVDSKISLKEFISLMYRTTGINCSQYKLKLISRYPMSFSSSVTYQGVPVEDEGDLHDVLCIPKNFPSLSTVEIYILQKDAQLSSGSVDNQTVVPNTIVGSYTQMLNDGSRAEIVGNERLDYGAFIAGSTRDVHRRNDRNMHGSSTSQMSCTLELESNKKFCEHDHYSTPRTSNCTPACSASNGMDNVTIDPVDAIVENDVNVVTPLVDSHGLDQAQSDEKDTDVHVETVLEDDCAHIPFYSDIGDVRDSLIDQFDHQRRPIWENDHNSELQLGIIFKSKEGVQHAVKMWSIRKRMHFKVYESTPTSWFVRCEYYKDKNCKWNVRAKQKKEHNFFEITKLNIRHTCVPDIPTKNDANLDCNMVGRLIQNHVKENPSYKVEDVAEDVAEEVKNLPGDTTSVLEDWWQQHSKWPYPTEDVKEKLVEETGLQLKQINNWFINQRKRNWQSNSQSVTSLKSKRKR